MVKRFSFNNNTSLRIPDDIIVNIIRYFTFYTHKMRFFIFFLLLFPSIFSSIYAQSFIDVGNWWHTLEIHYQSAVPPPYTYHTFRIREDTVIGGITYKKMTQDTILICAVRQDSNGNVRMLDFMYNHYGEGPNEDFMIYKFDAKIGDSIVFEQRFFDYNHLFLRSQKKKYEINEITILTRYGKSRKIFSVFSPNCAPDIWIEGIGSQSNPLHPLCIFNWENGFRVECFNGVDENGASCPLFSHELPNLPALSARPNPASDYITFSAVQDQQVVWLTAVRLYDLTGRLVSTTAYNGSGQPEIRISVADIANGMYLAVCRAGEQVVQQRVVVRKE